MSANGSWPAWRRRSASSCSHCCASFSVGADSDQSVPGYHARQPVSVCSVSGRTRNAHRLISISSGVVIDYSRHSSRENSGLVFVCVVNVCRPIWVMHQTIKFPGHALGVLNTDDVDMFGEIGSKPPKRVE